MFDLTGIEHWYGNTRVLAVRIVARGPARRGCFRARRAAASPRCSRARRATTPTRGHGRRGGAGPRARCPRPGATAGAAARSGWCRSGCIWSGRSRVFDNLRLARRLPGCRSDEARIRAMLEAVHVGDLAHRYPRELSQGQAQRVAIARAVINRPALVLADEPTANLDDAHAPAALELLRAQAQEAGATLVVASHDARVRPLLPARCPREALACAEGRPRRPEAAQGPVSRWPSMRGRPLGLTRLAFAYARRRPLATALVVLLLAAGTAVVTLTLLVARELEGRLYPRRRRHRPRRRREGQSAAARARRRLPRRRAAGQHPAGVRRRASRESDDRAGDSARAGGQLPRVPHRRHRACAGRALRRPARAPARCGRGRWRPCWAARLRAHPRWASGAHVRGFARARRKAGESTATSPTA